MECVELAKNYLTSGARIFLHDKLISGKIYDSEITKKEYVLMTNNVTSDAEIKAVGESDVESGYIITKRRDGVYLTRGGQKFYVYQRCSTPASSSSYSQYPQFPLPSVTRGAPISSLTPESYEEVMNAQTQQIGKLQDHINELDLALYGQTFSKKVNPAELYRDWVEAGGDPAAFTGASSVGQDEPYRAWIEAGGDHAAFTGASSPVYIPEYVPNANPPNLVPRHINLNMNRVAFPPQRPINRERGGRMKTKRRNKNKNKKKSLRRKRSKLTKHSKA